jgi:hypothetical protein
MEQPSRQVTSAQSQFATHASSDAHAELALEYCDAHMLRTQEAHSVLLLPVAGGFLQPPPPPPSPPAPPPELHPLAARIDAPTHIAPSQERRP